MAVKLKMTCSTCGSEDVGRDAWAEWDFEAQEWVLRDDPFDQAYCFTCYGETHIEEEEVNTPNIQPTEVKFGL